MFQATRRWLRRNRTTLLISAGVVGAGYVAGQYVIGKIQEARQRTTEDRISKENLRRRFEQNQEDCTYTVLALLPTIREEIIGALPVEQITEQLQQERQERLRKLGQSDAGTSEYPSAPGSVTEDTASLQSSSYVHASQMVSNTGDGSTSSSRPKRSKAQLWQEMKIHSVTRALTLIYTVSLLTMLTRIQLNLLGRRTYLSSVVALASPAPIEESTISLENKDDDNYENMYGNDFDTNRKYLTFSWWLLHRGSKEIMERVMAVVKDVFGPVNIREDISLERLSELIMQVRKRIEGATEEERRDMKWLSYLLPPRQDEAFVIRQSTMSDSEDVVSPEARAEDDPMDASVVEDSEISGSLRRLLDETSDLIDSPTFTHVLSRLLDTSFSHLVDYRIATEAYGVTGPSAPGTLDEEPRITEISDKKCKLAHMLPIFCKQAHVIASGSGEFDPMGDAMAQQALGNEYIAALDRVAELGAFAAVIYSSNFEYEVQESMETATNAAQPEGALPARPRGTTMGESLGLLDSMSLVDATDPRDISRDELEDSGAAPAMAVEEEGEARPSEFEAAWKKALSDEDGRAAGS
ncbi:peroxin [Extremus antarcticus]|uniref:Peroxin n=1 Tax=Extremus antarcticus TaxID=702011 RepID=A0AAJ0G5F9_9PEZI|nr:peroxin [Extremus antarcticus]